MHLTRDEIRALLSSGTPGAAREHLDRCAACNGVADSVALDLALDDDLAWELARLPELPRVPAEDDLEARAAELIAAGTAPARLAADPSFGSEEGALAMLRAAHPLLNVDPARLRDVADAVLAAPRPDAVTVVALRERANALRRTGDLAGALDSIARGREAASRLTVSDHELAIFDYVEATVESDRGRSTEARALASRALEGFERFGDARRAAFARNALAALDYDAGSFESARDAFRELADRLRKLGDRAAAAALVQNAGDCSLRLGDTLAARRDLGAAKREYEALGLHAEALSIAWLLARTALAEGRSDEAEAMLRDVAEAHDARELRLDAALARLDLVELLASSGRRGEAAEIARAIASVFAATGARGRLAEALDVLRQAAESGAALDEPLREARGVISSMHPSALHAWG